MAGTLRAFAPCVLPLLLFIFLRAASMPGPLSLPLWKGRRTDDWCHSLACPEEWLSLQTGDLHKSLAHPVMHLGQWTGYLHEGLARLVRWLGLQTHDLHHSLPRPKTQLWWQSSDLQHGLARPCSNRDGLVATLTAAALLAAPLFPRGAASLDILMQEPRGSNARNHPHGSKGLLERSLQPRQRHVGLCGGAAHGYDGMLRGTDYAYHPVCALGWPGGC